jgi:DNA-binding transcriptional regulator YhcF (GntR family)
MAKMDDDWVELVAEAKALGLTVEEVRDWLAQVNTEKEDVR